MKSWFCLIAVFCGCLAGCTALPQYPQLDAGPSDGPTQDAAPDIAGDGGLGDGLPGGGTDLLPEEVKNRTNGTPCTSSDQCSSAFCADGVCCQTACDGVCETCAGTSMGTNDGVCLALAHGQADPERPCAKALPDSCGTDGLCNGNRACRFYGVSTECGAASCSLVGDEYRAKPKAVCSGSGTCVVTSEASCGLASCEGSACMTRDCTANTECKPGVSCVGGKCGGKKSPGESCGAAQECGSGHCVDGVCCDSPCQGACQACSTTKTGMPNGVCANVTAGSDPDGECAPTDASTCGNDGMCNGAGACRKHAAGTVCRSPTQGCDLVETCSGNGDACPVDSVSCGAENCCNMNQCLDLRNDPKNCGACGRVCTAQLPTPQGQQLCAANKCYERIGHYPVLPATRTYSTCDSGVRFKVLIRKVTVPTAGTLTYIGARVPAAQTAGVQLGVYTDAGTRLAALNDTTLSAGVNEVSLVSPVALAAGDYWIAIGSPYGGYQVYEDTSVVAGAANGVDTFIGPSCGSFLPATVSLTTRSDAPKLNVWLGVRL